MQKYAAIVVHIYPYLLIWNHWFPSLVRPNSMGITVIVISVDVIVAVFVIVIS